jgi:protein-L-isoaspartate(D-aspartate) O-methyltransferase
MTNIALQRKNMVESQVRPSDVTDRRITSAMTDVPRERFVPAALSSLAYMDESIAVAPGRSLMDPRTFARLLQLCDVQSGDKVLIVGSLTGYSAAVIARLADVVVALESDAAACETAKTQLAESGATNVTFVNGALAAGVPSSAPFDVIFVEGAFAVLPQALLDQLSPAGRLVGIEASAGIGRAVVVTKVGKAGAETQARRVAFEAAAGVLPGFEPAKSFKF